MEKIRFERPNENTIFEYQDQEEFATKNKTQTDPNAPIDEQQMELDILRSSVELRKSA